MEVKLNVEQFLEEKAGFLKTTKKDITPVYMTTKEKLDKLRGKNSKMIDELIKTFNLEVQV